MSFVENRDYNIVPPGTGTVNEQLETGPVRGMAGRQELS
jgi:hypothetical protein